MLRLTEQTLVNPEPYKPFPSPTGVSHDYVPPAGLRPTPEVKPEGASIEPAFKLQQKLAVALHQENTLIAERDELKAGLKQLREILNGEFGGCGPDENTADAAIRILRQMRQEGDEDAEDLLNSRNHGRELQEQITRLADVLMNEFGGPTHDEGACDMAIRKLRELKAKLADDRGVEFFNLAEDNLQLQTKVEKLEAKVAESDQLRGNYCKQLNNYLEAAEPFRTDRDLDLCLGDDIVADGIKKLIGRRDYWRKTAREAIENNRKLNAILDDWNSRVVSLPSSFGLKTDKLCLYDISRDTNGVEADLKIAAKVIGEALGLKIEWSNVYHPTENVDGMLGHFIIEKEVK